MKHGSKEEIKNMRARIKKFEREHENISLCLKIAAKGSLSLLFGAYPIYYLKNIAGLANSADRITVQSDSATGLAFVSSRYFNSNYMSQQDAHGQLIKPVRKAKMMAMATAIASAFGAVLPWVL